MIDSIMIPADPKRDAKAAELARDAHLWPVITLRKAFGAFPAGTVFYGVPSSEEGRYYMANRVTCTCPDQKRPGTVCKHVRAVVAHDQRQQQPKRKATYTDLFGGCEAKGCQEDRIKGSDYCERHELAEVF